MKNLVFLIILLFSPSVFSGGPIFHELEGTMFIWGEHLPGNEEQNLEGASFFIRGQVAERLYKKMNSKPVYNECYADGTLTKNQGMFECDLRKNGTYSCSFGLSTSDGKIYGAEPC